MSKRTPGLEQRPRGFWPTPREAVVPLIPFLPPRARWGEPCAGDGQLIRHLVDLWPAGRLVWASDIHPEAPAIHQCDALHIDPLDARNVDLWITNPPWPKIGQRGGPALPIIWKLLAVAPVWALLPWDFAANDYFSTIAASCAEILPIGRVSWIGNGKGGKENAAWFRFDARNRVPTAVWPKRAA